jgi:hypothetical protein
LVKVFVDGRKVTSFAVDKRRVTRNLQRRDRLAVGKAHVVLFAVAPDAQIKPFRQSVYDRHAHTVQAAGDFVGVLFELTARVELGHDDFGGADAFLGVDAGRNATAVVAHGAGTVGIQDHVDAIGVAGQRLVDCVVHDLVDHVMQARAVIGIADIHARPLAHGIEALQHLDAVGAIFVWVGDGGRGHWVTLR